MTVFIIFAVGMLVSMMVSSGIVFAVVEMRRKGNYSANYHRPKVAAAPSY